MAGILIIDDDQDIVESMRVVLESRGHKVTSSPSGKEGLNKAKEEKPELIILDVMMETGDKGFEIAREIRKEESIKATPILMLTAIEEKTGMGFEKEAGDRVWLPVDDYAAKPLKPDELILRVEALLKKK